MANIDRIDLTLSDEEKSTPDITHTKRKRKRDNNRSLADIDKRPAKYRKVCIFID